MNVIARGLSSAILAVLATSVMAQSSGSNPDEEIQREDEIVGTLQNVIGTVLLKEGNESVPAVEGQQVRYTQEVLVTEDASALLVFNDGCDMDLEDEELYEIPRRSPCATLWWAGPAAAGVACGAAHANKSNNSRALAAVGLAVGGGLLGVAQGRETDFREYAAALESSEGEVYATNNAGELEVIRPGTRLRADQQVVVKEMSKAVIRFDDGCSKAMEVGGDRDDEDEREDRYVIPHNSPCFTPGTWWASAAAAAALCVTVEDKKDVASP